MGASPSPLAGLGSFYQSESWPDRCWTDLDAPIENQTAIADGLKQLTSGTMVPAWHQPEVTPNPLEEALIHTGFQPTFSQSAMFLDLEHHSLEKPAALDGMTVDTVEAVNTWTQVASASFGYEIDPSSIHRLFDVPEVQLLLTRQNKKATATALVYSKGDITGIHLVGVLPDFRGQGLARTLMQEVIFQISQSSSRFITLQASTSGEPLYRKLGFTHQFSYTNYRQP